MPSHFDALVGALRGSTPISNDQAHDIGILGAAPAQPWVDLIRHRPRRTPHEEAVRARVVTTKGPPLYREQEATLTDRKHARVTY